MLVTHSSSLAPHRTPSFRPCIIRLVSLDITYFHSPDRPMIWTMLRRKCYCHLHNTFLQRRYHSQRDKHLIYTPNSNAQHSWEGGGHLWTTAGLPNPFILSLSSHHQQIKRSHYQPLSDPCSYSALYRHIVCMLNT